MYKNYDEYEWPIYIDGDVYINDNIDIYYGYIIWSYSNIYKQIL